MKKVLCLFLSLVILLSTTLTVSATEIEAVEATGETFVPIPSSPEDSIQPFPSAVSIQVLGANQRKYFGECTVTPGTTILHIDDLTWYPTTTIEIGFQNVNTLVDYMVTFSGGSVDNTNVKTANLPSGSYSLYIENLGNMSISGTLYYNLLN